MFTLATDVQKIIMEFLEPQQIKKLYETCKNAKVMFEELTNYTNFIIDCKTILLEKEIKWFKLKNIKLKLFESYKINRYGDQKWYKNGLLHRDNDLPTVIESNGDQFWYQHNLLHRDNDLPAIILNDGTQYWYQHNLLHRDNDLPAVIWWDGDQFWYKNGIKYIPLKTNK